MCNLKILFSVSLLALFILENDVYAKRLRKLKRQKEDEDTTTPQADVITYSSYGHSDVGAAPYDGFVPSSPDYANFLSGFNQETTTRLYAPAFPTALDTTGPEGYNHNIESQTQDGQSYDGQGHSGSGIFHFQENSFNLVNPPNFRETSNVRLSHNQQDSYNSKDHSGDLDVPVYGTKLSSRYKNGLITQYNTTNTNYESLPSGPHAEKTPMVLNSQHNVDEIESHTLSYDTDNKNYRNIYNYAPTSIHNLAPKPSAGAFAFQKIVDFTKYKFPYPSNPDNNFYSESMIKSSDDYNNKEDENFSQFYNHGQDNENIKVYKDLTYKDLTKNDNSENVYSKPLHHSHQNNLYNALDYSNSKYSLKNTESLNGYKDKLKTKYTISNGYNADYTKWKNSLKDHNLNYVKNITSYKPQDKQPFQNSYDNILDSASNNVIDLTNYRFSKSPSYSYFNDHKHQQEMQKQSEYTNTDAWKNLESTNHNYFHDFQNPKDDLESTTTSTTSYWGNNFKTYSSGSNLKNTYKKPNFQEDDNENVVHIPKKAQNLKHNFLKYQESKPFNSWKSNSKYGKIKGPGKPIDEWNEEVANRFKSEEDLLGLRTLDTSHPSYLPTFKVNNDDDELHNYASKYDYKGAIEKWRQSYLKAKNYNWNPRDPESMHSESHPVHVPIPKPYPVEIPHPVIVPVPQPYPVRVPVPKPVAVPVVRELTVPVEKPVLYPVYKKVPYPVEKPVPVTVEKHIPVPVEKPYPVPIPHVRPIFHHSKPSRDEIDPTTDPDMEQEMDEDFHQPHSMKLDYRGPKRIMIRAKKPKSSRNQSRRQYQSSFDRTRRRWPPRRPNPQRFRTTRPRRLIPQQQHLPPHMEYDPEHLDHDHNDYYEYCRKRNGNC